MASATSPANKVERGHQLYREGRYNEALVFYTDALAAAKAKQQNIALHSNRAACYLKLHDFKKAAEECTSVLELDQKHSGALMLRAQTLVTLKEYHSALFDVNRLIELNPNSEVYQNLEARLRTQLSLAPIPESEAELEEEEQEQEEQEGESEIEPGGPEIEGKKGSETDFLEFHQRKYKGFDSIAPYKGGDQRTGAKQALNKTEVVLSKAPEFKESVEQKSKPPERNGVSQEQKKSSKDLSENQSSKGWQAIPKPKGHSTLDYARWDRVEDDSSEEDDEDDEDEECLPQNRFRVRTVGVRPVK